MNKLGAALLAMQLLLVVSVAAADVSGVWTLDFEEDFGGHPGTSDCTFKQDGRRLTVQCGKAATASSGEVNDLHVSWETKTGVHDESTARFTADLDQRGTTMKGTWQLPDRKGKFSATKH
jgi:hypothetical protein